MSNQQLQVGKGQHGHLPGTYQICWCGNDATVTGCQKPQASCQRSLHDSSGGGGVVVERFKDTSLRPWSGDDAFLTLTSHVKTCKLHPFLHIIRPHFVVGSHESTTTCNVCVFLRYICWQSLGDIDSYIKMPMGDNGSYYTIDEIDHQQYYCAVQWSDLIRNKRHVALSKMYREIQGMYCTIFKSRRDEPPILCSLFFWGWVDPLKPFWQL